MPALGRSLPPPAGSVKDLLYLDSFCKKERGGEGGWGVGPPSKGSKHGKMALGAAVGFLGIGGSS